MDKTNIIDLTRTLEDGQPGVTFEVAKTIERDGWNARTMHLYSHAGTHLDAPLHFACGDSRTVDQIPLESCMGLAHVVDLSGLEPHALIEVEHLGAVAEVFQPADSLLLRTGWSQHYDDWDYYRSQFPRVGEGLACWCAERGAKILGVEPLSVGDVNDLEEVTHIHEILLGAGIVIVEGLVNLEKLSRDEVLFSAIPLKVGGGDGCPCRAFAIEGELSPHMKS